MAGSIKYADKCEDESGETFYIVETAKAKYQFTITDDEWNDAQRHRDWVLGTYSDAELRLKIFLRKIMATITV